MTLMADSEQSSAATLGTALSWVGYAWFVFAVLWAMGAPQGLGVSGELASSIGSTIFPSIVLIGVGRALRRRARVVESPDSFGTPPTVPRPDASYELTPPPAPAPPKPARTVAPPKKVVAAPTPVVTAPEPGVEPPPSEEPGPVTKPAAPPKTSQELIEEARQRWGIRP